MKAGAVVLEIERIVAGGHGLARTPEGVVLVRGAMPGERVTARPVLDKGVLRAHAIEILQAHPARVDLGFPPGADLPLEYEAQLPIKQALVVEALERVGKISFELSSIAPSPRTLGYRTAAQYSVDGGSLGATATSSDRFVAIESDPLAAEEIQEAFAVCAQRNLHGIAQVAFRASLLEGRVLVGLLGDGRKAAEHHARALGDSVAGVTWSEPHARGRFRGRTELLEGTDRLLEDFGGITVTVTVQSFAQVNPPAAGAMYIEAAALAGGGAKAIDLYAGSGVLGLHLASSYTDVVAIEISASSVRTGEHDARRLKRPLKFQRGDARAAKRHLPTDLIALDPPRAGLSDEVLDILIDGATPKILYVSCDPTTWARDVGRLVKNGYRMTFARPYDFYPFTHHVEVLSLLERTGT